MKKILVVTHKPGRNYGGIMQAYALQKSLSDAGYRVETGDAYSRDFKIKTIYGRIKGYLVQKSFLPLGYQKFTKQFIREYIKTTTVSPLIWFDKNLTKHHAVITGSDQVWRRAYVEIKRYFLDFVPDEITKLSFAASFGRDDIDEYEPELKQDVSALAKRFKALSVREKSGVDICRDDFDVDATWHLDPVFLLQSQDYSQLVDAAESRLKSNQGGIFSYVLDKSDKNNQIIDKVSQILDEQAFDFMPEKHGTSFIGSLFDKSRRLLPVEQWLKGFRDSKFVITDSFHGTAFSIIFNKPFLAIGNRSRGLGRFISVLEAFGLADRMIDQPEEVSAELVKQEIDWQTINDKITTERQRAETYLSDNLA